MDQSKCKSDCQTFPDGRCRLALIGKTGSGKSSTGNTILSTDSAFEVGTGLNSKTKHGEYRYARVNDLLVEVLDTPGLADTDNEDMKLNEEIKKSIFCMHPGPHALLLVLRCNARFTPEDYQVFQSFKNIFGDELSSYTIVVFTGWDEMKCAADEFEIEIKKCKSLDKIMAEAGWRYLTFNNKGDEREKNEQVNRLIEKVKDLYSSNHFHFFRHNFTDQLETSFSIMLNEEVKRAAAEVGGTHESMKELSIYTNGFKLKQMKDKTPEFASVDSIGSHARQTSETDENVKTNYTKRMVQRFEANCISVPKMDPRVKRSTPDTKDRGNGNKEITAKLHASEANRGNGNKDMTSKLHASESDRGNGNTDMPAKLYDSEADRGNCNKDMTATLHDSEADRGNCNKDTSAKLHDSETDSEKSKNLLNTQIQVVQRKAKTQTDFKEQLQENIYTQSDTSNEAQQTKVTLRLNSEIILKDKIINHSETLSKSQRRQYKTSLGGLDDKVKDGFAKAKVKMIHQCKLM